MQLIHERISTFLSTGLLIFLFLSTSSRVQAQQSRSLLDQFLPAEEMEETGEIETDRDSFTPATTLVAPSKVMIESSYSFIDNRNFAETHSAPELLIRYGASDWLEFRFGTNYEIGGEASDVSSSEGAIGEELETGEGGVEEDVNVNYGIKVDVTDQSFWTPDSALILRGATPTAGNFTATSFIGTYVFGWELENGWVWDSAIRYGMSGEGSNRVETWSPSTVIKVPLTEKSKAHVEYFGIFNDLPEEKSRKHYISPGVHYLITDDFEIGIRVGWGLNHEAAHFFSNVGIGWQF
jgi:hypothetical protein